MDRDRLALAFPAMMAQMVELVIVYTNAYHDADLERMQLVVREQMEKHFQSPPFVSDVPGRTTWIEARCRQAVPEIVAATHDASRTVMLSRLGELAQRGPAIAEQLLSVRQDRTE